MNRRLDVSRFFAASAPTFIIMRMAVGAVYQTVTLYLAIRSYHVVARKPPS